MSIPTRMPSAALSPARSRIASAAFPRCLSSSWAQHRTLCLPARSCVRGPWIPFGVTKSHPLRPGSTRPACLSGQQPATALHQACCLSSYRAWTQPGITGAHPLLPGRRQVRSYASKRPPFESAHHDLPSFRAYARAVNLSPTTTTYVGTLYEYTVLISLQRLAPNCFALSRTGGVNDRGIDLAGTFVPPHQPSVPARTLPVFIQCKAEQKRTGPKYMRELEGTLAGVQREGEEECLGILAAVGTCTKGMREQMVGSRRPLMYVCVTEAEKGGWVRQMVWNEAASEVLGRGLSVGIRYVEGREEVMLMLDGVPVSAPGGQGTEEST